MLEKIALVAIYFFFYSALGWLVESIYCSIAAGKIINRGFLTGPICPIYGTGAVVMTLVLTPLKEYPILVFIVGLVVCDIVEFATSYIMEKLFHARWWDYSNKWLNIQGRICFRHSMYWGIASVLFIYFVHPNIGEKIFADMPAKYIYIILAVILVIFAFDLANAVHKAMDIKAMMDKLKKLKDTITAKYEESSENAAKRRERLKQLTSEYNDQITENLNSISNYFKRDHAKNDKHNRMVDNYPNLESGSKKQLDKINSLIDEIKRLIFQDDDEMY